MGLVLALIFFILAAAAVVLYGGTPHGGPTISCGPIMFFSQSLTVDADCRYVSVGELVVAGACFFLTIVAALTGRPGPKV